MTHNVANKEQESTGLIACSSFKGKKKLKNEDQYKIGCIGGWKVLVIVDGVTNSQFGGEAAQIAVDAFYEEIERACSLEKGITKQEVMEAYQSAVNRLRETALQRLGKEEGFETTIITIIEAKDKFIITYLGDGRIYLVRGDLEQGIQLMVTHRVGDVLGGALGPYGLTSKPVYIEHSKSFSSGEIIIAGSDGAFEIEGEASQATVVKVLEQLRKKNLLSDNTSLQQVIAPVLEDLSNQGALSDDATLGIIITDKAYQTLMKKNL